MTKFGMMLAAGLFAIAPTFAVSTPAAAQAVHFNARLGAAQQTNVIKAGYWHSRAWWRRHHHVRCKRVVTYTWRHGHRIKRTVTRCRR
jgi:hypothetical protein